MAELINLQTHSDERGSLTVIENILPFDIKRVYYIYNVTLPRGGHRHKKTVQALIAINGSCEVYINTGGEEQTITLNNSAKCLILQPEDWHSMYNFKEGTILLALSSENYDVNDYIMEKL